jgi:hypothetical protein
MRRARTSGGEQPGLKRRPLNASDLNKALGIDPSSPNPITDRDLAYQYDGIPRCVVSIGGRWKNYHGLARYGACTCRLEDQYRERRAIKTPTSNKAPTTLPPNSTPQASSSLQGRRAGAGDIVSPRFATGAIGGVTGFTNGPPFGWVAKASIAHAILTGVTIYHVDHYHAQNVRGLLLHCGEKLRVVLGWSFG